MKAKVDKVCCHSIHPWKTRAMGQAEAEVEFFKNPEDFRTKPGSISELKGMSKGSGTGKRGQEDAEMFQPLFLEWESGWKLPEHNSQFLLQWRGMIEKEGEGFSAVSEALDMGDEPASLDGKGELLRSSLIPALEDLFLWQAIEGDIELDRIKMLSIEFQPLSLREIGGVEDSIPPMGVIVAAGPDEDPVRDFGFRTADYEI